MEHTAAQGEEFVTKVEGLVAKEFVEAGEQGHDTWQELFIWMVCFFKAEDQSDLSNKDIARIYQSGLPALTQELARDYLAEQYCACDDDEGREGVLNRVTSFLK